MNKARAMFPLRPSLIVALLIITAIGAGLARGSRAQNQTKPADSNRPRRAESLPPPSPTPPKKEDDVTLGGEDVVRVETNLTNIFFTASDKQKRFVSNLKREDIRVFEDGVPQEIFTFQRNLDLPLSLAILIDCSGSEERTLPKRKRRLSRFLNPFCAQTEMRPRWFHSPAK